MEILLAGRKINSFIDKGQEYYVIMQAKKEFRKVLSSVAEQGYAIDHGEDIDGINCIGAPILNEYGYPVAAIWISAPSGRLKSEDFIEKGQIVKQYAAIISEKLGFI